MPRRVEEFLSEEDIEILRAWVVDDQGGSESECRVLQDAWRKFPAAACVNADVYRGVVLSEPDALRVLKNTMPPKAGTYCSSWSCDIGIAVDFAWRTNASMPVGILFRKPASVARKECLINLPGLAKFDWSILRERYGPLDLKDFLKFVKAENEVILHDKGKLERDCAHVINMHQASDKFFDLLREKHSTPKTKPDAELWDYEEAFELSKGKVTGKPGLF